MSSPERVRRLAGITIRLELKRPNTDRPVVVEVTPEVPRRIPNPAGPGTPVGIEALGIAYTIVNGQVLYEGQRHTGVLPGQVLRPDLPTPSASPEEV